MRKTRTRRATPIVLLLAALLAVLLLQACAPVAPAVPSAETPSGAAATAAPVKNALGKEMPADAAPLEQQVLVVNFHAWKVPFTTVDFYQAVYERADGISDVLSDSLVRLDKNFQVHPGAATEWSLDDSGLVWTFKLDPNLMWNDGTPVTADDYVATFRYGADPAHAWDFSWYFQGVIENWKEAVAGEVPLDKIGVAAIDANTLQFTTESPAPYLPAMLVYSTPLQKKALETHGGLYNSNPETSVSSGPYKVVEFNNQSRVVYEINPDYKGTNIPYIEKVIVPGIGQASQLLPSYQANEIDYVNGAGTLSPADLAIIEGDSGLSQEYHPHYGDFRTYYFFFDDTQPPFDDLKVRQAFARVLDRDAIMANIVKRQGMPAYSFLMPGFPASNSAALQDTYPYDVEKAKQLMTDAGYADGEGFPKLTLKLRAETAIPQAVAQAYVDSLKDNLGIEVEVQNMDFKTYMEELNADPTALQFGMISYGMDFLDPSNMLGVFRSGGRHQWANADYDTLFDQASQFTGNADERIKMFQDAEKILVEDVGAVFAYHQQPGDLIKPYLVGPSLEPDANGVAAWHWPGFSGFSDLLSGLYVAKNVSEYRPTPPH